MLGRGCVFPPAVAGAAECPHHSTRHALLVHAASYCRQSCTASRHCVGCITSPAGLKNAPGRLCCLENLHRAGGGKEGKDRVPSHPWGKGEACSGQTIDKDVENISRQAWGRHDVHLQGQGCTCGGERELRAREVELARAIGKCEAPSQEGDGRISGRVECLGGTCSHCYGRSQEQGRVERSSHFRTPRQMHAGTSF